ncbi:MAG: DUF4440 domain-containing protein [Candidatus Andersenbacteria bacterium]
MDSDTKKLIETLEIELLRPEILKSTKRLAELISDDFLEFGASGNRYGKKDILETLPSLDEVKYDATNMEMRELANNTILLTYSLTEETVKTGSMRYSLRCSIWKNDNGNWQMIFHQGTPRNS